MAKLLTKSKYMSGLQCPKYLWLIFHDSSKIPGPDASTQHIFDQGHLVGELAKRLYPGGINIPATDFMGNINQTRKLLAERKPLFEAGFMAGGLFSRLDILNPCGREGWDIVEVKSSTSVKEENLQDVAFQRHCCRLQGLQIDKCYLAFINNQFVKQGAIDPAKFFTVEDITEGVETASRGIEERIASMFEVMASSRCPETLVSPGCREPYDCPVTCCWEELPAHNILTLYRGGKKAFEMFNRGILNLKDIPDQVKLSEVQKIQKQCDSSGSPHIEKKAIQEFLQSLKYPLHYLDFETFSPAIPLFEGTRPYQKIPFQYSLHVDSGSGSLQHFFYLAEGTDDPRPELLRRLKKDIGPFGSLLTYNQSFEKGVLEELGRTFPEYSGWVSDTCARLADLMLPFRNFDYYHPAQAGSASIKHVLPALTGRSYDGLNIANGDAASLAYLEMTYSGLAKEAERQIRADLEKYCGLDTEAMHLIVKRLSEMC